MKNNSLPLDAYVWIAIALSFIGLATYFGHQAQHKWEQFKVDKECRIVTEMIVTNVSYIVQEDGAIPVFTTERETGWLCNDGVTYYK